jgi:hypothetical protein
MVEVNIFSGNNYTLLKIYAILLKLASFFDRYTFTENICVKKDDYTNSLRQLMSINKNNFILMRNPILDDIKVNIPQFKLDGFNFKRRHLHLTVYYPPHGSQEYNKEVENLMKKINFLKWKKRFV